MVSTGTARLAALTAGSGSVVCQESRRSIHVKDRWTECLTFQKFWGCTGFDGILEALVST
jgi:hypothetical protein